MKNLKRTKKILKNLGLLALSAVMVLGLAACGSNASTEKDDKGAASAGNENTEAYEPATIRLAVMSGDVTAWTAAVGEELGIYEKYGLDLEVTEFAMGINTLDAVTTDQADIGFVADFACVNRLGNTDDGATLRVFSRLAQVVDYRIYAVDDITSLADLKGKSIGVIKGTIYEYLCSVALQSVGLSEDDVDIKAYESNQEGLALIQSGKLDAMWSGGMANSKLDATEGVSLLATQEDLDSVSSWVYMANESYLSENQEVVERYLEATQEVYDAINADLESAAKIVEERTTLPQDDFLALISNYEIGIDFDDSAVASLDKVNEWARVNGYYEKEYDIRDYIDASAVTAVYPDLVADELK